MRRRRLLRTVAAAGGLGIAGVSGCSALGSDADGSPAGADREVVVSNATDETVLVAVRIEGRDGAELFGHVYELGPGKTDETAGDGELDATPHRVVAFLPDGAATLREEAPPADPGCEGRDVGVRLKRDGSLDAYYNCSRR